MSGTSGSYIVTRVSRGKRYVVSATAMFLPKYPEGTNANWLLTKMEAEALQSHMSSLHPKESYEVKKVQV